MAYLSTYDAEGDVEGVMDRPIGNTAEVHAECEKWYVLRADITTDLQLQGPIDTSCTMIGTPGTHSAALRAQKPNAATSQP